MVSVQASNRAMKNQSCEKQANEDKKKKELQVHFPFKLTNNSYYEYTRSTSTNRESRTSLTKLHCYFKMKKNHIKAINFEKEFYLCFCEYSATSQCLGTKNVS